MSSEQEQVVPPTEQEQQQQQNNAAAAAAAASEESKKRSAYHYWHGDVDNKKKTGDVAPMPVHVALTSEKVELEKIVYKPITKYSWCDNEKTVDVYVDWPELKAETVSVDFTNDSVCAKIQESETLVHRLTLKLSKGVLPEECKFRCKPAMLAIKLKKEPVESWFDLEAKPSLDI